MGFEISQMSEFFQKSLAAHSQKGKSTESNIDSRAEFLDLDITDILG